MTTIPRRSPRLFLRGRRAQFSSELLFRNSCLNRPDLSAGYHGSTFQSHFHGLSNVGQTFLSASWGDFPVAPGRTGKSGEPAGWKACPTLLSAVSRTSTSEFRINVPFKRFTWYLLRHVKFATARFEKDGSILGHPLI